MYSTVVTKWAFSHRLCFCFACPHGTLTSQVFKMELHCVYCEKGNIFNRGRSFYSVPKQLGCYGSFTANEASI